MATNEKWEAPPYQGSERTTRETQASNTTATSSCGVESQAQYTLESYDYNAHPEHGYSSSTPNAKAKNALDDLQDSNNEDASGELRIVLIGKTGTGKSSTGNSLIGENFFKCKGSAKSVTSECAIFQKERFGKTLVVVDTPGFLDTNMSTEKLSEEFLSCTCFTNPGIHALLLVFQVGHRYIDEDERAIRLMKDLFSKNFVNRTVAVFTGKDMLEADEQTLEDYISELPKKLKKTIESCKGGAIAICNRGEQREEAAKDIISKVEEVVEKNGGESQYYKTVLSVEISEIIDEEIKKIEETNVEVLEKKRQLQQEMEKLSGEDQRIQRRRKELEGIIDNLDKKVIDKKDIKMTAIGKTKTTLISFLQKFGKPVGIVSAIGTMLAFSLKLRQNSKVL